MSPIDPYRFPIDFAVVEDAQLVNQVEALKDKTDVALAERTQSLLRVLSEPIARVSHLDDDLRGDLFECPFGDHWAHSQPLDYYCYRLILAIYRDNSF